MGDLWYTIFRGTVEKRPVITQVGPRGHLKVITTPIDEIAPERLRRDQELIAIELEEYGPTELARALRKEGFSDPAVYFIISKANIDRAQAGQNWYAARPN